MNKRSRRKLISLFVAFVFTLTQLGVPSEAWGVSALEVKVSSSGFHLTLPPELGTIQALHSGSGPTFIHIQTAHGNFEAQKKVQAILHYLKDTYGFRLLLLEGSASKLNPELLKFFPNRMDLNIKIAEELAKKALVKGDELFLLEEPEAEAYGIEDTPTYRKTREAFKAVILQKEETDQFLGDMDIQIERLTGPYLNQRLRSFLRRLEAFESKILPLLDWLTELKAQAKKVLDLDLTDPLNQFDWPMLLRIYKLREFESQLDLNAFARERGEFLKAIHRISKETNEEIKKLLSPPGLRPDRAGGSPLSQNQLPDPETGLLFERMVEALPEDFNYNAYPNIKLFIGHLILQSELKGERLLEEMSRLTDPISHKLAKTEEEKKILRLLKDHRLLKRLFALELTPEDYEAIASATDRLHPSHAIQRFLQLNHGKRVRNIEFSHLEEIDSLFEKALEFYQGVKERDKFMLQNIEKILASSVQRTADSEELNAERSTLNAGLKAIVITGGFHAGPFRNFFESQGFSYALIAPKITTHEGREAYIQAVLQNSPNPLTKSTMDLPRLMELRTTRELLGSNPKWETEWIGAIRQRILKQAKEPIQEGPPRVSLARSEIRVQEYSMANIDLLGGLTEFLKSEWNRLADEGKTTRRLVDIKTKLVGKFVLGLNPYIKATAPTPGFLPVRPLDPAAFNFEKIKQKLQIFAQFEFFGKRYFMFPDANPIGEHHSLLVAEDPRPNALEKGDVQTALLLAEHNPELKFLQNTEAYAINHLHIHTMTNVFPFESLPRDKEEELGQRDGIQISTMTEWPLSNVIFRGEDIEKLAQEASRLTETLKTQKNIPHWTFISKRQVVIFVGNSNPQPIAEIEEILGKYHKIHVLETVGIVMLEAEKGATETGQKLNDQTVHERYERLDEKDIAKALNLKSIELATFSTFLNQPRSEVRAGVVLPPGAGEINKRIDLSDFDPPREFTIFTVGEARLVKLWLSLKEENLQEGPRLFHTIIPLEEQYFTHEELNKFLAETLDWDRNRIFMERLLLETHGLSGVAQDFVKFLEEKGRSINEGEESISWWNGLLNKYHASLARLERRLLEQNRYILLYEIAPGETSRNFTGALIQRIEVPVLRKTLKPIAWAVGLGPKSIEEIDELGDILRNASNLPFMIVPYEGEAERDGVKIIMRAAGLVITNQTKGNIVVAKEAKGLEAQNHGDDDSSVRRAEVREESKDFSQDVNQFLTLKERNLLGFRVFLFSLGQLKKLGKTFLIAVLIALGVAQEGLRAEVASVGPPVSLDSISIGIQGALNFTPERIDAAKRFLGIKTQSQVREAYLLGADLALNEGGLALIETIFKDSLVAIVAHNPAEVKRLEEYNQERIAKGKSRVLMVKTLRRAEQVLTQKLKGKGIVYGFASPREVSSEWIRILKQNFQVMSQARLQSFAESFGILTLAEEFKARFQIERSA